MPKGVQSSSSSLTLGVLPGSLSGTVDPELCPTRTAVSASVKPGYFLCVSGTLGHGLQDSATFMHIPGAVSFVTETVWNRQSKVYCLLRHFPVNPKTGPV